MSLIKEIIAEANKNWPTDAEVEEFFAKRKMQPLTKRQRIGGEEDFVDVYHNEFGQRFTDREALKGVEDKMARRAWQWYSNNKWPAMESFLEEATKEDNSHRLALKDVTTGKYLMSFGEQWWNSYKTKAIFTKNPMNAQKIYDPKDVDNYVKQIVEAHPELKDHEFKLVKIKRTMVAHEVEEDEEVAVPRMKGITVRKEPDTENFQKYHIVLRNRRAIGSVWYSGKKNWSAEVLRTGTTWDHIDTRRDAIKLVVDEA